MRNNRIPVGSKVSFNFRDKQVVGQIHHRNEKGANVVFVARNPYKNDVHILADNEIKKI